MGFWSRLLGVDSYDAAQRVLSDPYEPFMSTRGIPVMDPGSPLDYWTRADIEHFWRTQPNLRKVVGFVARSVASTPLHAYERISDTERRRVSGHPLSQVLSTPRPYVGPYRFWEAVLSDGLLYDRWAVLKRYGDDGRLTLSHIPSWRLRFQVDALREVVGAAFWVGDSTDATDQGQWEPLDLDALVFDHGYAPRTAGLSPVETLKDVLDETAEAIRYRRDVWENGARMPGFISRPAGVKWEQEQRDKFAAHMRAVYGKDGPRAGGMPVLEDGMEIKSVDVFSPQDAHDLEGRQLSAVEVASAYHISPELVGAREGNYSNIDAFRQMMYGPSLGPYITAWEQAINVGLTPELAEGRALYVEANVESKLRGSFLEQAQVMSTATGAPYLTRDEVRALQNRPPLPDGQGQRIVTPLNVLEGGQASPRDSGSQNLNAGRPAVKSTRAPESYDAKHEQVLRDFFTRQEKVIRSRLGAKAGGDWWDASRWDSELADELVRLALLTSETAARTGLEALGLDPDSYDVQRTLAYLRKVAEGDAERINEATRERIEEALASDDPAAALDATFEDNRTNRATVAALTLVTAASAFGAVEAAKQQAPRATKTWRTTSGNPRASHSRMNGETVGIEDRFSNGMTWPGSGGDVDETAGCRCTVDITIP